MHILPYPAYQCPITSVNFGSEHLYLVFHWVDLETKEMRPILGTLILASESEVNRVNNVLHAANYQQFATMQVNYLPQWIPTQPGSFLVLCHHGRNYGNEQIRALKLIALLSSAQSLA
jgi:hypothetical protein